jgi:ribose/xylose/arabinose/galactoside ABC-type transport system permease subunit
MNNTSIIIFVVLFVIFGILAPRFFTVKNFENIMYSSSYMGIIAIGMTFVLLTGGIDLSIGSNMYLSGVVAGVLINNLGLPVAVAFFGAVLTGLAFGAINAFLITKLKIAPFITTLGTLIAGRGLGLIISRSYPVNFPESVTLMGATRVFGFLPLPVLIFLFVVIVSHTVLTRTQIGRQIYAVGNNAEAAGKAGIDTLRVLVIVYLVCGLLAALGGFVSTAQLGRIQPNFGEADELDAIAAAVLGGTSLFGGIGGVLPGTLLGTILIQMIQAGLVFVNMDIYIQPIVMAGIIFLAVLVDSLRLRIVKRLERRHIMKLE